MEVETNKRPREDDEFEDSKRQHGDPTVELISNICKDIRRIGESSNLSNQIDDISYISNPIVVEFEKIDNLRTAILNTLNALVIEQPQKISSLSVLILICNAKNFLVSKYVIEFFHSKIQTYLYKAGTNEQDMEVDSTKEETLSNEEVSDNFNNIKSILKFLCCLCPILENYSIINVLRQFLTLAIDLQSNSESRNPIAEEIFYNTLVTIPYLFTNEYNSELVSKVNELLEIAQGFKHISTDNSINYSFDTKFDNLEVPYTTKNLIDIILPSLKHLQEDGFEEFKNLFINYTPLVGPIITEALSKNKISNELVKHPIPQFSITVDQIKQYSPKPGTVDFLWTKPRYVFQVYNNLQEFETLPKAESYLNIFFKDICIDLLTNLSFNKNETSVQLSILDLYFNSSLFSPPGSSIDTLTAINNDNLSGENTPALSTWKIEDLAVESVLTMIFQLPLSLDLEIYYYSVLISCCKENPEAIAPVFGRAIRFFYRNLVSMDFETKTRFMDWMSIQISNFEFSWKWDEWVDDSKLQRNLIYHPQKNFVKNLIAKEIKLSTRKRIKESFVAMQDGEIIDLEEFNQHLNLNIVQNESKFIINYDSQLFGGNSEVKELVAKTFFEKKELIKITSSPQSEMFYIWSDTNLPFFPNFDKLYKFLLANNKSNKHFHETWTEFNEEISDESIDKSKLVITYLYQAYCHIGARSIYSTISILNRDLTKLKWCSGVKLTEEDYKGSVDDFRFPDLELTDTALVSLQNQIIDSIFRIWLHQPQFIFLILEYLIEVKIIPFDVFINKCFGFERNLLITNITCFESINRSLLLLENPASTGKILGLVVEKLVEILTSLNIDDDANIVIDSFEESQADDLELMKKIDSQWLFFEYVSLFKFYLRRFKSNHEDVKQLIEGINNKKLKQELTNYMVQIY